MREFLKDLDLDSDTIDIIMAQYGKSVARDKEEIQNLKEEIEILQESSSVSEELQAKYDELLKEKETAENKKKDEELTKSILEIAGDKKFINDYTKNSIVSEVKRALSDEKNSNKTTKDLFEEITKDKEGIFANPNQPADMPGANDNVFDGIDKNAFEKMGYKERVELKAENPELFEKLNNSQE